MFILKDVDFSKLIHRNLSSKHILIIEYINLDGKKIRKSFKNDGKHIHVEGIKELIKARVGHDEAWKNVLDIVKKKMLIKGMVGLSDNIVSLDNVYFLYGSKFLNPKNKLDYITKNINIKNIIPFKCKKIEEVIDEKIKRIMNTSDLELLDNYNGDFKLEVNKEVTKYNNKSNKRINSKYQYGHINSFINIIQDAKKRNLKELIIFEDDVLFHNYIKNFLLNFSNIKKNADIIYFGASKHNGYYVDNSEYKCKNVTGTFAVFIKNKVFDDYLELLNLNLLPSDVCLAILLQKYKTYVYEPNIVIADLNYSSIRERNNIKETYKKFNWNLDNYKNYENKHILVVLPTFNRSENIENIINMINKQSYKYYDLLIIDDGSNISHKTKINQIKKQNKNNSNIIFKENNKNLNIANTLNKGIQFFKDNNNKYSFFTWISDDNIYHEDFLEKLITDNSYFKYSSFNLVNIIKNTTKKVNVKYNIDNLLNNFKGCASFMWTKEAILNIGFYNSTINGCEDLEYLIRTFKTGKVKDDYEEASLMDYIRHTDSLYVKDNENIIKLKNNILKICKFLNNNNANLIYYSKTNYNILFQRPQQIMRFYDKTYNKVFIGNIENVELDEKYGLLIVPYSLKDCVFNFINNNKKYLYFTDSRLYNDITDKTEYIKIYDLIDAPIEEFKVWKPNLELCVKNSNHVMYSHPKLINYLQEIDNTKEYTYISNACDYKHFSKAKNRIGKRPSDFPLTNKPILGYYGSFAEWLDFDIIRKYADEENYHIVMIGGIPSNKNYNLKFQHANITWLDHKPYNELPYYLSWFDKCFLPFKDCKLTKFVNPCKLWEYMASEKEIIKHNINMEVDKLITYDEVCDKMKMRIIQKKAKIGIILDKYLKGGIEKHSEILKNELDGEILVFNESSKNHLKVDTFNHLKYNVILWQNVFNELPQKKINQKYIYIVHSECDWWNYHQKNIVKKNNYLIDTYIFVSERIKEKFERDILVPKNSYVIENQVHKINNDKQEIPGLFISSGSFNKMKGHFELIQEFRKLDKSYSLEIYGDIHDKKYFDKLKKYITENQLNNIKLYQYTDKYIERLKEAEYFCLFSKSEGCSYSVVEAINLNKKIICSKECITSQSRWYPNIYIIKEKDYNINWFQIEKVNYLPYSFYHFIEPYKNLFNIITKKKIGYTIVNNTNQVLEDLNNINNINEKNGYSALIRIKNEEDTIEKCILDIIDLVDEIIIVDNNSTDNTLNIVKKLEIMFSNVYVYQYKIDIPRYGNEHIKNYEQIKTKNNTLANYYNWTSSKATFNKKIKWDGDFYCIRNNLKDLLNEFKNKNDLLGVHFSGLTLFKNGNNFYIKNGSYYNEYRLFCNKNQQIWSDNIFNSKNYCETSEPFCNKISNKFIYKLPIFLELKTTSKDEFSSRSSNINDGRDNVDKLLINQLKNNIINKDNLFKTENLYYDLTKFKSFINDYQNFFNCNKNYIKSSKWFALYPKNKDNINYSFKYKKAILFVIDTYSWCFGNILKQIKKNNNYEFDTELYVTPLNKFPKKNYDIVLLFWYGGNTNLILDYYKKRNTKVFLSMYDYSLWINNTNKKHEEIYKGKLHYFIKNIDGYLYGCPNIKNAINNTFINNKLPCYPCFDGVDSSLFNFIGYEDDIYIKEKLTIGWIGNSNPNSHGINKGFELIKNSISKLSNKYVFKPQDIYTGVKLPHDKIPEYLQNIDIIVCFSIAEGTPNQILEASSSGKCWISTDVGIVNELNNTIKNKPCGLIINRDLTDLENALSKLYNNRNLIVNYGKNGRKSIERSWDWSKKVKQFYTLFDK